jgi:hypothetical protein
MFRIVAWVPRLLRGLRIIGRFLVIFICADGLNYPSIRIFHWNEALDLFYFFI